MRVAALLALGAVAGGGAAYGQEAPGGPQEAARDVIVVTGIGPARSSDELIASTTVLDKDTVIERLGGGLGDTLEGLPGVSSTAFGPGASRPVIRGLGAERVQVLTNGIGVIDASAASPDHAVTGDPLGAERIEVLRGPATLAYGGGASGGVVNVIDGLIAETKPSRAFSANAYAGYTGADEGETGAARFEGAVGPLAGVLSGAWRTAGNLSIPGFAESSALHEEELEEEGEGHEEHEHAEGVLPNSFAISSSISGGLSLLGEDGFIGFAVRDMDSKYGIPGAHHHHEEGEEGDHGHDHEEGSPFIRMKQTRYDLRAGLDIRDSTLKRVNGSVSAVDYEHVEVEGSGEPATVFTNQGFEGRVEFVHGIGDLDGSAGLQLSRRDFRAVGEEAFVSPTVTTHRGIFLFESFERGEWGVEGGLRYDRVELDNDVFGDRDFDTLNASMGVHGHVTENLFLGASVNRTERAPADVELFADGAHLATQQYEIGDASLRTERGVNVEVSAWGVSGPLKLGASIYHFDFSDFIYLRPTGEEDHELPVFQAVQADAEFVGAEATAELALGQIMGVSWRADAAADIVRGELKDGGDLPRIPPVTATFGVEAEAGRVSARLEARWSDEQDRVATYELPTDAWTTLGLMVNVKLADRVSLILEGSNLTDEDVRLHASPLKDVAPMAGRGFRIGLRAGF